MTPVLDCYFLSGCNRYLLAVAYLLVIYTAEYRAHAIFFRLPLTMFNF